jgi:hypothetical protein
MNIKKATLIAICGNAAVLLIYVSLAFGIDMAFGIDFYKVFWRHFYAIIGLLGYGTVVLFLFTLYRKQP